MVGTVCTGYIIGLHVCQYGKAFRSVDISASARAKEHLETKIDFGNFTAAHTAWTRRLDRAKPAGGVCEFD